jgi:hypothetical protein
MSAVALRRSQYRCGSLPGKGKIRNFRFDRSYSDTCENKTIFIMVAGQRELDVNVASDSKWVIDIHLIGSVQSRKQTQLFVSQRLPLRSRLREDFPRLFRRM